MASSWRDLLPKIIAEREAAEKLAVSSASDVSSACEAPNGPNGPNGDLAAGIVAGLARLRSMRCPSQLPPTAWSCAVADALRLASDGWALSALSLGWSPLDLFGAVPDKCGDPDADGLAVKLAARSVVALCGSFATVRDARSTTFIHRGNNTGAKLMWDLVR